MRATFTHHAAPQVSARIPAMRQARRGAGASSCTRSQPQVGLHERRDVRREGRYLHSGGGESLELALGRSAALLYEGTGVPHLLALRGCSAGDVGVDGLALDE